MTDIKLSAADFAQFFQELHGETKRPFPWQQALVTGILKGRWPETIAVPTASGKTSIIDAAVFAMAAADAHLVPLRRIFFVVDRRVVVEEAYESACRLAKALALATDATPVLYQVANRLRELAGGEMLREALLPLEVFQLRGGIYRERAWARTPLQPVVVTTTVDQIGSRLLYRGYGCGNRAWPVQAGLVANDSLVVLDEAHCSQPFQETMAQLSRFRTWGADNPVRPSQFVYMTATPRSKGDALELSSEDRKPEHLGKRLSARKLAKLVTVSEKGLENLVNRIVDLAETLERDHGLKSVGIVVNRVATARRVFEKLRSTQKILLTGRMRQPDRDRIYTAHRDKLVASPARPRPVECLFTVATQCIEVGANIDFEGLITECASLDSLRQRFGRLDRLGLRGESPAAIVIQADQIQPKEPDPIYGTALPQTWNWLNSIATNNTVDFGIEAMHSQLPTDLPPLQLSANQAPILLPAYLDRWVQTSPPPLPDPDPAIFLHGPDSGRPDVSVIWRADLDYQSEPTAVTQNLSALLPTSAECAPVPLGQFLHWLAGKEPSFKDTSDIEIGSEVEDDYDQIPESRRAFLWRGPDDNDTGWVELNSRSKIRPGDVLVVSALDKSSHALADFPKDERPFWDLGDQTQKQIRRRCAFRLHPELLKLWGGDEETSWTAPTKEVLENGVDFLENPDLLEEQVRRIATQSPFAWLQEMAAHWLASLPRERRVVRLSRETWVLFSLRKMELADPLADLRAGSDLAQDDSSSSSSREIRLRDHCSGVARMAAGFARGCGLSEDLVHLYHLAGQLHDVGKADPRFQAWLFGGNALAFAATGDLWAKSSRNQTRDERSRARVRSGYPSGGRHELVSARIATDCTELLENCVDPELLIHLVATHHGYARPFAPNIVDDSEQSTLPYEYEGLALAGPVRSGLERLDSGQIERFWRLVRRYGWWGLAWLESLLILADHLQSDLERGEPNG